MSREFEEPDYRLSRNSAASCRLNAQHYLWRQVCGFNISPELVPGSPTALKIADVATGTGIWMIEVADEQPLFSIAGSDKSLQQCPPAALCPPKCSIHEIDILNHVPDEFQGYYDIVHVRLIQGGLKDDPTPALKNLIAMLKPGGHLQWQEVNKSALTVTSAAPDLARDAMNELQREVSGWNFGRWVDRLADICKDNGLEDSRTDKYRVPPHLAIPFCQTQLGAYEEISKVGMDNSTPESPGPKFRDLLQRAHKELNAGVWLDHNLEVTIARKPFQ